MLRIDLIKYSEQFRGIKVSADKIQSRAEKIQELESKDEITK